MELKTELLEVFNSLGVSENAVEDLKNFYLSRLTNVRGTRDQIAANIESLQVQLTEAQMAVALVEAEINKVTVNENPVD
jgi:hypothetical protein